MTGAEGSTVVAAAFVVAGALPKQMGRSVAEGQPWKNQGADPTPADPAGAAKADIVVPAVTGEEVAVAGLVVEGEEWCWWCSEGRAVKARDAAAAAAATLAVLGHVVPARRLDPSERSTGPTKCPHEQKHRASEEGDGSVSLLLGGGRLR